MVDYARKYRVWDELQNAVEEIRTNENTDDFGQGDWEERLRATRENGFDWTDREIEIIAKYLAK
jgi:hypothetical protein